MCSSVSLFRAGLATVFAVLAFRSWQHLRSFRHTAHRVQYRNLKVTDEYRKFCQALNEKS